MSDIMAEVESFLDEFSATHGMTFGLEYSAVVDWCAEFVPGKNHAHAREYTDFWLQQDVTYERAIRKAMQFTREALAVQR